MKKTQYIFGTFLKLGFGNLLRIALYRISLKSPFSKIRRLSANPTAITGPYFTPGATAAVGQPPVLQLFGTHQPKDIQSPPNWLRNPLNGQDFEKSDLPFWQISDFNPKVGDIKQIWELSRFSWVLNLALEVAAGKDSELSRLDAWVTDWVENNPPYAGPNWKCGQEASLRVLNILVATVLIDKKTPPLAGLVDLISAHLDRIALTVSYAKAQDNNHGTSEAAALFIGGQWLLENGHKYGAKWSRLGRNLLENRVAKLISDDGSFSQYSVNYHRMMLDTLSISEWWRARKNLPAFSDRFQKRAKAASTWLYRLTDPISGDCPNIGANDGAHLFNLSDAGYRDYRLSVCMAYALWHQRRAYVGNDMCDKQLQSLDIVSPEIKAADPDDAPGLNGGFAVINRERLKLIFRVPRFRFRPSQADALHLDIWRNGENIFRDGGTYSYNSTAEDLAYFGGTASHNTVEFDGRDQMPRLGRFLFGKWLKVENWSWSSDIVEAGYTDYLGASHKRQVRLLPSALTVTDEISGFNKEAKLRWRFQAEQTESAPVITMTDAGLKVSNAIYDMLISASAPFTWSLEDGFESRFYLKKISVPVLSVCMNESGQITTHIKWKS